MEYNLTTSGEVIARVIRDFKVNNVNWKANGYDWIADAMSAINAWLSFEPLEKCIPVCDYKAKYPCNLVELIGVKYRGCKLPLGKNITRLPCRGTLYNRDDIRKDITNYEKVWEVNAILAEIDGLQLLYQATPTQDLADSIAALTRQIVNYTVQYANICYPYNNYGFHYYNLKPGCVETTFEHGEITLVYVGATSDADGLPLIPDTYEFKEAIAWFIMSRLLMGGYEHPVFNYKMADEKWEHFKLAARNKIKMPSIDRMTALRNMWTSPVVDRFLPERFFEGAENITEVAADFYWPRIAQNSIGIQQ